MRINQGPRVIFVAKRNIRSGEEVTDCYGIHHLSLGLEERRTSLLQGYRFDCACVACKKDLPSMRDLPSQVTPQVAVKLGTTLSK